MHLLKRSLKIFAVDLKIRQLWVFVYGTSKRCYAIDFSPLISLLFAVKKRDTQKKLPVFDSPIHGKHDGANCSSVHPFVHKLPSL